MLTYSVIVSKASFFLSLAVAVELVLRGISHNECDFALTCLTQLQYRCGAVLSMVASVPQSGFKEA